MARKVQVNLHTIIIIALLFLASFGFNLYQRYQYLDLLQDLVDTEWKAQNMEASWVLVKNQLKACKATQNKTESTPKQ